MEGFDSERRDRRKSVRREEDEDLREEMGAMRIAMFGHPEAPETGLMARHAALESKIDELITETQRAKWSGYMVTVSVLTGIVIALATQVFG